MNQVTQSLRGALRPPSQYSPGSGGDCWEERNQLSLKLGEERGGAWDAQHPLAGALSREVWSNSLEERERAGQGKLERKPRWEVERWPEPMCCLPGRIPARDPVSVVYSASWSTVNGSLLVSALMYYTTTHMLANQWVLRRIKLLISLASNLKFQNVT